MKPASRLDLLERRVEALERALAQALPSARAPDLRAAPDLGQVADGARPRPSTRPDPWADVPLTQGEPTLAPTSPAPVLAADAPTSAAPTSPASPEPSLRPGRPARPRPAAPSSARASEGAALGAGTVDDAPRGLEAWLGGVVLGRVGIALLVLAAVYFAQLAYREVGDTLKVLSLYGWSGALVAAGALLRRRGAAPRYVGLLWGGGTAVAYVAGLAATLRYGLVSPWVGVALLAGASALGQALARRLRVEVLAVVSLVSAALAPVLLGVVDARPPFALLYGAALQAWAAFTEARYGWRSARLAAFAGAGVLAARWYVGDGSLPGPGAFVLLHLALLAGALPEVLAVARRRSVERAWSVLATLHLGLLGLVGLLAENLDAPGPDLRGLTLAVGAAWTGLLALLGARAEGAGARPWVRALAETAALLLVLGCSAALGEAPWAWPRWGALAAATPALLLVRRATRAGDPALLVAALLALTGTAPLGHEVLSAPTPQSLLALLGALALRLVPAAGLVAAGRSPLLRAAALGTGTLVLLLAFQPAVTAERLAWLPALLALPAAWLLLGRAVRRPPTDPLVASVGCALLGVLGLTWLGLALAAGRTAGWPEPLDPATLAALLLAGAGALAARQEPAGGATLRPGLVGGALGLLVLAGWREVTLRAAPLGPGAVPLAQTLYVAASALLLGQLALHRRRLGLGGGALLLLGLGGLLPLLHALEHASVPAFAAELGGAALLAVLAAGRLRRLAPAPDHPLALGSAALVPTALAWAVAASGDAFPLPAPWLNLRLASALLLALLLALAAREAARRRAPDGARGGAPRAPSAPLAWALGLTGFATAFSAVLLELVLATRALPGALGPVLVSVYLALCSAAVLRAGFAWRLAPLRVAALAGLAFVVGKVGLHDLAASSLPVRVLVSAVLGLVLLGSAYGYARSLPRPPAGG